ncbi:Alpha-ketoglutarate permease [Escherichia coli]|nr:Alpha-ketoglutarate permease [Escherichia coli]
MPMMFVDELGFTTSEWLQVWAAFFFTTIFSNIFWGIVAEKMGWMRVIRWFGCLGMAASSLAFYYMPQYFGHNYWMAMIPAIALGTLLLHLCRWPLSSRHWNQNTKVLQSRFTTSLRVCLTSAPAIAVVLLPWFSTIGVVIAYTALYLLAFVLCAFIRVEQPIQFCASD